MPLSDNKASLFPLVFKGRKDYRLLSNSIFKLRLKFANLRDVFVRNFGIGFNQ